LLALAFSLAVIAYVLVKLDWKTVFETFARLDWGWLGAAFIVYLLNYVLRTLRFRLLLDLTKIPFQSLFSVTNLYGMYLYLMPAKSGEVSYPLLLKNKLRVPLAESTATLIAARFFDFATVALFLPAVLAAFWEQIHPWLRAGALVFVATVFLFGGGLLWLVRNRAWSEKINPERGALQISSGRFRPLLQKGGQRLLASLAAIDQRGGYGQMGILTVAIWLCVQINFYFIVLSLGQTLTFWQMIVVSIIMVPMTLLPLQGFANLGTHEIGWTAAFALFGYPEAEALNIAVSSHIILLLFVLLLGALGAALMPKLEYPL
jgi:uncharacterized protein (TIRG00374 family)